MFLFERGVNHCRVDFYSGKKAGQKRWVVKDEPFLMFEGLPRFPELSFLCWLNPHFLRMIMD